MLIKFITGDPSTVEFSPTRKYSKHLFYPFPRAPAIFTCLSGLIISCRLRVTDSRQYRRNLRAVTRQNCARRQRRRRGRCESATTWRRRFPKHLRIVASPSCNKLLDIRHYLRRTNTRSFHRATNRRRTNTTARLYVTLQQLRPRRMRRSKRFSRC